MTITFPRNDVLTSAGFEQQVFDLVSLQELSRQANGVTRGKDLGSALWFLEYVVSPLEFDDAVTFEALLHSLDGVIEAFGAYDLRRPYPKAHADGAFNDTGTIKTLNVNNKALSLQGLDAGFVLSIGDYLAFDYGDPSSRALHQVMEAVTADGSGDTAEFEVRPHIRDGAEVDAAVTLKKPSGYFTLQPGPLGPRTQGLTTAISFKAVQTL